MEASAELPANGIGVFRAGDVYKGILRIVLREQITRNPYTRLLSQLDSGERVGGWGALQSLSCFMFSIHLCLLVLLNVYQIVLKFLVELLLLLELGIDGNEILLDSL